MIVKLEDPFFIPQLKELYREGMNKDPDNFEFLLYRGIGSSNELILIDVVDKVVNACLYTVLTSWECEPVAFIQVYLSRKGFDTASVRIEGMNIMEAWAKSYGIKAILSVTEREVGAFEKRYHFHPIGTVIRKPIL
ncbi:MAG: hypothetical protein PHU71_04915 [Candidatus Gracilibacteria bacterium]|nr:hypothetical protein [Candidatus Gracilibacteria bacterium]